MPVRPVNRDAHDGLPQQIQVLVRVGHPQGVIQGLQRGSPFGGSDVPKHHVTTTRNKIVRQGDTVVILLIRTSPGFPYQVVHDQSGIVYDSEYDQSGTMNLYDPEYDQPVFVWEETRESKSQDFREMVI